MEKILRLVPYSLHLVFHYGFAKWVELLCSKLEYWSFGNCHHVGWGWDGDEGCQCADSDAEIEREVDIWFGDED